MLSYFDDCFNDGRNVEEAETSNPKIENTLMVWYTLGEISCGENEMQKLYQKHELWFALGWIAFYVVAVSFADELSRIIGIEKIVTLPLLLATCVALLLWMKRNDLFQGFGLCKGSVPPSQLLWYLPLAALISSNLWFGLRWNLPPHETLLYIASMICVGFVEEVIFRGLLFNAMRKDGLRSAVIVSSLTFGIGHIVNLFNGSGVQLLSNLCQVGYAAAVGFLFVILFLKTGSLIPCIITHSVVNALSVFANKGAITAVQEIFSAIAIAVIALAYSVYLLKKLPE